MLSTDRSQLAHTRRAHFVRRGVQNPFVAELQDGASPMSLVSSHSGERRRVIRQAAVATTDEALEAAVALPLRCALGLPPSVHRLSLFVEYGLVRPRLWFVARAFRLHTALILTSVVESAAPFARVVSISKGHEGLARLSCL